MSISIVGIFPFPWECSYREESLFLCGCGILYTRQILQACIEKTVDAGVLTVVCGLTPDVYAVIDLYGQCAQVSLVPPTTPNNALITSRQNSGHPVIAGKTKPSYMCL